MRREDLLGTDEKVPLGVRADPQMTSSMTAAPQSINLDCLRRRTRAGDDTRRTHAAKMAADKRGPSIRAHLFQQQRVESLFDTAIDRVHEIVKILLT